MAQLREQTHIELVDFHSKVERLSEGIHCMGETSQARAESVHTELLRLQEAAQARSPLPVKVSSLVAQFRSFQERQAQFEKHMEDSVAQQVSQLRMEMSRSPPHTLCRSWWLAWRVRPRKFVICDNVCRLRHKGKCQCSRMDASLVIYRSRFEVCG